jgi:predicted nucleic acid-binding protein
MKVIVDSNILFSALLSKNSKLKYPFVALTIFLDGYLWTGDKKLKKSLEKKGFDKFFELY